MAHDQEPGLPLVHLGQDEARRALLLCACDCLSRVVFCGLFQGIFAGRQLILLAALPAADGLQSKICGDPLEPSARIKVTLTQVILPVQADERFERQIFRLRRVNPADCLRSL